ncbi:FhaA domain-containing protein [Luteimicrobium sp. NPDC057192]|uniref:FhaA domain-containing protein n=1 Tax=Luteimicrobium sp. NPDC057192 TaxID=3346042 RepID=UPI0036286B69
MGVLDRFEQNVERAFNNAFAKLGRGEVKPVDLASALRREVDDRVAVVGRDRAVAPNEFTIRLASDDFARIEDWGAEALADELASTVTDHAAEQHYAFVGPVSVTFDADAGLQPGQYLVHSASVRGSVPANGNGNGNGNGQPGYGPGPVPSAPTPSLRHPLIDIDGQRYLLTGPVTVIGRGSEADIVVDDPGVSRRHLEIRVTPDGVVATDLGSTNGLFVEGHQVPAATLLDGNSLTIGRTRIMFWTGAADEAG